MIFNNPFAVLAESISPILLQIFVIIMVLLVIIGTLVVDDYGVSSDESDQRHSGFIELHK